MLQQWLSQKNKNRGCLGHKGDVDNYPIISDLQAESTSMFHPVGRALFVGPLIKVPVWPETIGRQGLFAHPSNGDNKSLFFVKTNHIIYMKMLSRP